MDNTLNNAWVLILAAGASSRFGGVKALAPWHDGTLLSAAIKTASTVCANRLMIITGAHHEALVPHLSPYHFVFNEDWQHGMGSSIRCGISAIEQQDPAAEAIVVLPVDQPFVTAAHLRALIEQACGNKTISFTTDGTITGPPAALHRSQFGSACAIPADKGLKALLPMIAASFVRHETAMIDIDTPGALNHYSSQKSL